MCVCVCGRLAGSKVSTWGNGKEGGRRPQHAPFWSPLAMQALALASKLAIFCWLAKICCSPLSMAVSRVRRVAAGLDALEAAAACCGGAACGAAAAGLAVPKMLPKKDMAA